MARARDQGRVPAQRVWPGLPDVRLFPDRLVRRQARPVPRPGATGRLAEARAVDSACGGRPDFCNGRLPVQHAARELRPG